MAKTWLEEDYPEWKRILWRGFREFLRGAITSAGMLMILTTPETFLSKEGLINWIVPILTGAVAGGIGMLGMYMRDLFPESKVINKLPV